MTAELSELVGHLCDKLTGMDDGKPKVIRQSALDNIQDFFQRFSEIGIRSNEQLETLARKAKELVDGADAAELRKGGNARFELAAKMAEVRSAVDGMVVVRRREIQLEDEPEEGGIAA